MNKDNKEKDWSKFKEEFDTHEEKNEDIETDAEMGSASIVQEPEPACDSLNHPSYTDLEEKLTLAEQKAHENWEKSVRAMAELDNVRRRMEREVSNAHKYGGEKIISALLPIIDSLEQALQLAEKSGDTAMHEGLELTMKLFIDALEKSDVAQLDPLGQMFDPQQHEAMAMQPAPDAAPNTIIAVFQKGYTLNNRVIRPARVIVAKNA